MTQRCAVCDQLLLADDTVCWQCGHPVAAADGPPAAATEPDTAARRVLQLSPRLVYSGLTLLVIVAALLVTTFLGRQPRAQTVVPDLPTGWVWVRGGANSYTFFLPQEWEVLVARNDGQEANLNRLVGATPSLPDAYRPLGILDKSLSTLFYGHGPIPGEPGATGLVLVARSRALNQLDPAEMVEVGSAAAAELGLTLDTARRIDNFDQSHVYVAVTKGTELGARRCQQRLYPGRSETILVSACGPQSQPVQRTLETILSSFQRQTR